MPRRIWVLIGAILVVLGGAFAALVVAVPDPAAVTAAVRPSSTGSNAAEGTAAAPSEPGTAVAAADPATPSPELVADLQAFVIAHNEANMSMTGLLRQKTGWSYGRDLTLNYEVDIDLQSYRLPADPTELTPGFEAYRCPTGGNTCYRFTDVFAANVCSDATLGPLIQRGAAITYIYNDLNYRYLGNKRVVSSDCLA